MASGTTPLLQTNNISEAVIYRQALNDFYNKNVKVGEDGRVLHEMYLWEVKNSSESKDKYDLCKMVASVPGEEAFRPLKDGGCYFVKA
jgi:branched-chain amino acid transport system substrate-binding protein